MSLRETWRRLFRDDDIPDWTSYMWELRRPNVQGLDYINVTERPLAVFSFWFLVVVAVAIFHIYRAWHVRKHPCSPVTLSETSSSKSARSQNTYQDCSGGNGVAESAAAESVIEVEESEGGSNVQFDGYRKVIGGEICWCLLILGPLQWICLYIVVLLDAYYSCQLTGINNLCFYGTYFIFGSYDRNGSVRYGLSCMNLMFYALFHSCLTYSFLIRYFSLFGACQRYGLRCWLCTNEDT